MSDAVGAPDAEHDPLLKQCFVDTGLLNVLSDIEDHRSILLGRTGSGKTALLRMMMERFPGNTIALDPADLALPHVGASTVIQDLHQAGVPLDILFKAMWRHVICVELIRFRVKDRADQPVGVFLSDLLGGTGRKHQKAIEYIERFGRKFWLDSDVRVLDLVERFSADLTAKLGIDAANLGGALSSETEKKQQIVKHARSIIDEQHAHELGSILALVDDVLDDRQRPVYVTIDGLDEAWAHESIRLALIRSLVETTRDFRRVRYAKLVLAMRRDLLEQVQRPIYGRPGLQREKVAGMCLPVEWSKAELKRVASTRIAALVRKRYEPKASVEIDQLLEDREVDDHEPPFAYIVNRTLMRPRDLVDFLNKVIAESDGDAFLKNENILSAEIPYSLGRLEALSDEWISLYPTLKELVISYPTKAARARLSELSDGWVADYLQKSKGKLGDISDAVRSEAEELYQPGDKEWPAVRERWVQILYDVGVLGFSRGTDAPRFSSSSEHVAIATLGGSDVYLVVHKAFRKALGC